MSKANYYVINGGKTKKRAMIYVFFGIAVFVLFFFPFFGLNLRYQIGSSLALIINGLGTFSLAIGALFLGIGIVGIFTRSRYWPKQVILGIILLWIGAWCTGAMVEIFGLTIGGPNKTGGSGYH